MPAIKRSTVLLLIPHLNGGGAERVMSLLARSLSHEKYDLHLGVITAAHASTEECPAGIHLHILGASRVRGSAFRLTRLVHRLQPDLILSGMFHLNFLVLLLRPFFPEKTRVLVRQNGTASAALEAGGLPWFTRPFYRLLYRSADRVICQTEAMAADLAHNFGVPTDRLAVLPNPVDVEGIRTIAGQTAILPLESGARLLAVGRLVREKGFDLLLRAMVAVCAEFPETRLLLAGSGPVEAALKAESHRLGLDATVNFAGAVAQPWQLFSAATLFVLSSRQEGLPNALLEAAAGGLPIVALPASGGVADLLRGQPGVWLAPEISAGALSASLLAALRALRPGERFAHSFIDAFGLSRAIPAYESLIDATLQARRQS